MNCLLYIGWIGKYNVSFFNRLGKLLDKEDIKFYAILYISEQDIKDEISFDFCIHTKNDCIEDMYIRISQKFDIISAILWNGVHGTYPLWRELIQNNNIKIFYSEKSGLKDTYFIDETGLNGFSEYSNNKLDISKSLELSDTEFKKVSEYIIPSYSYKNYDNTECKNSVISRIKKCKKNKGKIIAYFGIWDEAAGLFPINNYYWRASSPHFKSSFDGLKCLNEVVDKGDLILVKEHPFANKMPRIDSKNIIFLPNNINPLWVVENSDIVITIISTVSLLALIKHKPLILLGNTYLSNKGYSYDLKNKIDLSDLINESICNEKLNNVKYSLKLFLDLEPLYSEDIYLNSLGVNSLDKFICKLKNIIN